MTLKYNPATNQFTCKCGDLIMSEYPDKYKCEFCGYTITKNTQSRRQNNKSKTKGKNNKIVKRI